MVLDPPHSLLRQSYAPRRQRHGTMNADGWGVGFLGSAASEAGDLARGRDPAAGSWAGTGGPMARWREAGPLWSAQSFASVAPHVSSTVILAAVRDASAGMPADSTAAAPFAVGGWLLSHNGVVDRGVLPAEAWRGAESVCDSAVLAAHVLAGLHGPHEVGLRVAQVGRRDPAARLNVLATDGTRLVATVWGDTLSVLETADGTALASEPWDDHPGWRDLPDRTLVTVDGGGTHLEDIS